MKKKRADRIDWKRIKKKRFVMKQLDVHDFRGYVSLLCLDEVHEPLWVNCCGQRICLVDNGYMWLQHFPSSGEYALTTAFNAQGEIVEWYVDITKRNYLDERGVLWYEDLYLDLDISPEIEVEILDVDELDEALAQKLITPIEYDMAWRQLSSVMTAIEEDQFPLFWSCIDHLHLLKVLL